jgi:hypothetical protein
VLIHNRSPSCLRIGLCARNGIKLQDTVSSYKN